MPLLLCNHLLFDLLVVRLALRGELVLADQQLGAMPLVRAHACQPAGGLPLSQAPLFEGLVSSGVVGRVEMLLLGLQAVVVLVAGDEAR